MTGRERQGQSEISMALMPGREKYACKGTCQTRHPSHMVHIPAGAFLMGSAEGSPAEMPEHAVDVSGFWLDRTPVTNAAYAEFTQATGYITCVEQEGSAWAYWDGNYQCVPGLDWRTFATPGRDDHPVVLVTWFDAIAYCDWAGARLPTEAEWEKAARGGLIAARFPWGDGIPDETRSNFAVAPSNLPGTAPVQGFPANRFGLYDMVGNVWQWCSDWYSESYYGQSSLVDPRGPVSGTTRIRRGGAWNVIQPFRLRCANRGAMLPSKTATNIGFRCARNSE
jgi:formylglycine-generating enzyme required for sulfatase activity